MVSKEYQILLEQIKSRPSAAHLSIEETRDNFEQFMSSFPVESDIKLEYFSCNNLPACWISAPYVSREKVVFFIHGGGFDAGSIKSHAEFLGRISRASGFIVLAIGYHLAPEYPFPAALDDVLMGYQWLLESLISPSNIIVAGSSAGGNLAVSLCLKLKTDVLPLPGAVVCISPMFDLASHSMSITRNKENDWYKPERRLLSIKDYCVKMDCFDPLISPLYGDLSGLPRMLIQVGTYEILYDEIIAFVQKAQKEGIPIILDEWPEMIHCWHFFASKIPEGKKAIENIGKFIREA